MVRPFLSSSSSSSPPPPPAAAVTLSLVDDMNSVISAAGIDNAVSAQQCQKVSKFTFKNQNLTA